MSSILNKIKINEILFLQRIYAPIEFLYLANFLSKKNNFKIVFDFDDANYLHWPRAFRYITTHSNAVITGSNELYRHANKYNQNSFLIPTSLPIESYTPKTNYSNKIINVGWIGNGPAHIDNLTRIKPVVENLKSDKIHFTFIGTRDDPRFNSLYSTHPSIKLVKQINWKDTKKVAETIQKFDIGIMPLEDTPFNRGKCAFKILEYMACGIPAIASPVGQNKEVIQNFKNGLLARNLEDWQTSINKLATSVSLRKKYGKAGRKTVVNKYSYKVNIPKLVDIINQLSD